MEHELLQSKLKHSVDSALVSNIIRSSSSGLSPHRTAAMELILERSIQERRERMFTKAKNSLRPDPTPQPKIEVPNTLTPQMQSPTPTTASQPPSRSLPDDTTGIVTGVASASANHEALRDSSTVSKPAKKVNAAQREGPPADVKTNLSPSEDFVELACWKCSVKQLRSGLRYGLYCSLCPVPSMVCVGCGAIRVHDADACNGCHGKFK